MSHETKHNPENSHAEQVIPSSSKEFEAHLTDDAHLSFDSLHDEDIPQSDDSSTPGKQSIELAQLKDALLRAHADMENLRRRSSEELAKAHKYAIEKFAESLVVVQDSMEKALDDQSGDFSQLKEGVELTSKQLSNALQKHGMREINPILDKFDPNFHQAISMTPNSEHPPGTVVQVLQKGYVISDRILRPALVIVAQ